MDGRTWARCARAGSRPASWATDRRWSTRGGTGSFVGASWPPAPFSENCRPGTPPSPWTFPLRNRLLASLGDAVIVVEAGPRSGALITVEVAAELGRPVFAVPGPIVGETHVGCNRLLYDGATPLFDPEQALEDFLRLTRMERGPRRAALTAAVGATGGPADLGSVERLVLLALDRGPSSIDQLASAVGADVGEASRALTLLELRGLVARAGPGCYRRM